MRSEPSRRGRGRPPHPDILTPREWQVLALLRQGLTQRTDRPATRHLLRHRQIPRRRDHLQARRRHPRRSRRLAARTRPCSLVAARHGLGPPPRLAFAGAAVGLAALVALGFLAWSMRDRDEEQQAVAAP